MKRLLAALGIVIFSNSAHAAFDIEFEKFVADRCYLETAKSQGLHTTLGSETEALKTQKAWMERKGNSPMQALKELISPELEGKDFYERKKVYDALVLLCIKTLRDIRN